MKEQTANALIFALNRNADETEKLRKLLKPEIDKTLSIQRVLEERQEGLMQAKRFAERFAEKRAKEKRAKRIAAAR